MSSTPTKPPPTRTFLESLSRFLNIDPPNLLNLTIWTIGVTFLTSVSIVQFLPLLDDYRFNNVDTRIAIIRDGTPRPPNLTACIPYHSHSLETLASWVVQQQDSTGGNLTSCMDCEELEKNFQFSILEAIGDRRNFTASDQQRIQNLLANALLKRILKSRNNLNNILVLNRTNFNWNQPLLDAIKRFYTCSKMQDTMFLVNDPDTNNYCGGFDFSFLNLFTKSDLFQLFTYLVKSIEIYLHLNFTSQFANDQSNYVFESSLSNRTMVVLPRDLICFPLLPNAVEETFSFKTFSEKQHQPPWKRSKRIMPFLIWEDDSILRSFAYTSDAVYCTASSNTDSINEETVELTFDIAQRVIETRNVGCIHEDRPNHICVFDAQIELALESCRCIPLKHFELSPEDYLNNEMAICNKTAYERCRTELLEKKPKSEAYCRNKCEYTFYRSSSIATPHRDPDSSDMKFTIQFQPHDTKPYIEFKVCVKDTFERFISSVGGLVNLYVGFSGLTIFATIIFCVNQIRERLASDHSSTNGVGDQFRLGGGDYARRMSAVFVVDKKSSSKNRIGSMENRESRTKIGDERRNDDQNEFVTKKDLLEFQERLLAMIEEKLDARNGRKFPRMEEKYGTRVPAVHKNHAMY